MLLGGLIWQTCRSLICDCALYAVGSNLSSGTNMLVRASSLHLGIYLPYGSSVILFTLRNQYKLAILLQLTTALLCLMALKPRSSLVNALLKRVLLVSAFL